MIDLKKVQVIYNKGTIQEKKALGPLDLRIKEGEFITVIGSNGAGKTTLLNVLAGESTVNSGKIIIDNIDVTKWPTYKRAGLVARVFQDPMVGTCGNLTIAENLTVSYRRGALRGFGVASKIHSKFKEMLAELNLGLESRLHTPIGSLSGGQRQAISLLMASMAPLKILLLDEHTAALDPKTAESVMQLTSQLLDKRKLTTLMVTHSMHQALDFGSRTLMLHEGQIIFDTTGEERANLKINDLLAKFHVDDDKLLLNV